MKPYSEIRVGDIYASVDDPLHGLPWEVVAKNDADRLVQIRPLSDRLPMRLQKSLWKRPSDRVFRGDLIIQGSESIPDPEVRPARQAEGD